MTSHVPTVDGVCLRQLRPIAAPRPGFPVVMPGESIGGADEPWLKFIRSLEEWGERFPGFELESAELRNGKYYIYCLRT